MTSFPVPSVTPYKNVLSSSAAKRPIFIFAVNNPPLNVPVIIFIVACFIAFSTGTSWGTFAIMIAIGVPMAQNLDANIYLTIAAALGGGVFGDHCSPISDTTIISSMASASDHIDHVKTQLPYALTAGIITSLIYLILGVVL